MFKLEYEKKRLENWKFNYDNIQFWILFNKNHMLYWMRNGFNYYAFNILPIYVKTKFFYFNLKNNKNFLVWFIDNYCYYFLKMIKIKFNY